MQLDARGVMRAGGILALAAAAGVLFRRADLPLAWVLGPLLVVALFSMAGVTIKVPPLGRRVGQLVVGAAIGLQVTPAVAGRMLAWLPAMVLVALASVAVSALLSRGFSKFMRLDPATAYFSLLPGGMAEMANIGQAHGARSDVVAISQTIRLGMVVFLLPPICGLLVDSRAAPIGLADSLGPLPTLAILALAALGVGLTTLIRLNNPWMIGALLAVGLAAGFNLVSGHIAFPLQAAGQFLIGISIGTRFQREALRRMPRVVAGSVLAVLALSAILFAVGAVLSLVGPIDLGTAVLSSSAGGIAEMTLTAQNLGLDAPLVAGFHFVRTVIVNGFAAHVWTRARRKS